MKDIYYFTNIAPHYREEIWRLLESNPLWKFYFVFGKNYSASPIKAIDFRNTSLNFQYHLVKNIAIKSILVWQKGVLHIVLFKRMSSAVFLGDMHIVSNWIAAMICRVRGIKVTYWGHGFSGNEGFLKRRIRILFNSLADEHLLYGQRAKDIMINLGFSSSRLHIVYNSLAYSTHLSLRSLYRTKDRKEVFHFFKKPELPVLLFIGRLTPVKKIHLLLQALNHLNAESIRYNLLIIGTGEEKDKLEELGSEALKAEALYFYGKSYDEEDNAMLIAHSDLCVSPGNVGLTAIHSLSYGTPVATHNNFSNQMPEFEVIEENVNGFFFHEGEFLSLARNIENWFSQVNYNREAIRENCFRVIDRFYNPQYQLSVFEKVLLT